MCLPSVYHDVMTEHVASYRGWHGYEANPDITTCAPSLPHTYLPTASDQRQVVVKACVRLLVGTYE